MTAGGSPVVFALSSVRPSVRLAVHLFGSLTLAINFFILNRFCSNFIHASLSDGIEFGLSSIHISQDGPQNGRRSMKFLDTINFIHNCGALYG